MTLSQTDRDSFSSAMSEVWRTAEHELRVRQIDDLDEARAALLRLRNAILQAGLVIADIERGCRQQAAVELEHRVQGQVGFPREETL